MNSFLSILVFLCVLIPISSQAANPFCNDVGANCASDVDTSGTVTRKVKIQYGADGTKTDVSIANPFPVQVLSGGGGSAGTFIASARVVYSSTNVTTSAYTTLISSTTAAIDAVDDFDSSGQTLRLGWGASCGAIVDGPLIYPGGFGLRALSIPQGSCVGIKAISATANSGEADFNFMQ